MGTQSELDRLIPPEIKNDEFYHYIEKIAAEEKVHTILEIGSSAGAGSTQAFVSGIERNPHKPILFCMEISKVRFRELAAKYKNRNFVKCYNYSSVPIESFPSAETVSAFYHNNNTKLNQHPLERILDWLRQDIEYATKNIHVADGIQKIKEKHGIKKFDLVLIDGSEFTGAAELDQIYGARIIMLDDIDGFKNHQNYFRLKNDDNYQLVKENWTVRNGFAVFKRKYDKLPVHFFTIVLNGLPFLQYHIEIFKTLPFEWCWHIVEGVEELKHDTAWSVPQGGKIDHSFHSRGLSMDGSTQYIDELSGLFPDKIHVYRKSKGELWDGKLEMISAPIETIDEPCLLWQIDADELWTAEQIRTVRQMFLDNPQKTVAYYYCHYFVGPHIVTTTRNSYGNQTTYEWLRTWRYRPGDRWISHEPPRLCRSSASGKMVDTATINPFKHSETEKRRLVFQHFAYATEDQVRFKESYFGYSGALRQWRQLQVQNRFPVRLGNYFLWVKDDTLVNHIKATNISPLAAIDPENGKWHFTSPKAITNGQRRHPDNQKPVGPGVSMRARSEFSASAFRRRYKNILIVSHERSGTHFLINSIALNIPYYSNREISVLGNTQDLMRIFETYYNCEENRIFKSHHQYYFFAPFLENLLAHFHLFYIVRDGRDVLTSMYHYFSKHPDIFPQASDIHAFIRMDSYRDYLSEIPKNMADRWSLHVKSWMKVRDRITIVRYEDLKLRFNRTIADIADVLGADLPATPVKPSLSHRNIDPRKGVVGDWQTHLSPEDQSLFDQYAREAMVSAGYFTGKRKDSPPRQLLWVRTDALGDNLLSASMLPYLATHMNPDCITVVCQEHLSEIYHACPLVNKVVGFDRARIYRDESYREEIVAQLRAGSDDYAINSVYSSEPLTHLLTLDSGAGRTIGIDGDLCNIDSKRKSKLQGAYSMIHRMNSGRHRSELEKHRELLGFLNINVSSLLPIIWTTSEDERFADDVFRQNRLVPEKTIALFAGAQFSIRHYFQYGKALSRAIDDPEFHVIALGSEREKGLNQQNLSQTNLQSVNLCGRTTIRQAAALIKRCRLALGAETGLAHVACAVGTPNVVLLGGGHFGRFMPYSTLTTVACLPLSCYGCDWHCAYERPHCVQDISPHTLAEAVRIALQGNPEKIRIVTQDKSHWTPSSGQPEWRLPEITGNKKVFSILSASPSSADESQETLNSEGEHLTAKGALEEAVVVFRKVLASDPRNARAHNNLGVVYYRLDQKAQALEHYKKAARIAPQEVIYQKNLADFYCIEGIDIQKGMEIYLDLLRNDPNDTEALYAVANICTALGRHDDAKSFYDRLQALDHRHRKIAQQPVITADIQNQDPDDNASSDAPTPVDPAKFGTLRPAGANYLVSAIVSTYNAGRFIKGCLEDLENQTMADRLEIIVIDSGSQENEVQIVNDFQQRYGNIKYIRTRQRETVYAAWNRGIREASGKYITNANTDDRHRRDALEVLSTVLETLPEVGLVYGDVIITETENETFDSCTPVGFYRWMNFNRDDLLEKGCFMGPQPMWRKDIHEEYGYFDESFVTSGDYEFWLRISQTRLFLHIPVLLGLYLKSPGSIEHTNRKKQARENRRIFKMYSAARSADRIIRHREIQPRDTTAITVRGKAETRFLDIQALARSGKQAEAIEELVAFTGEYPLFAPAYNDLGILYHHHGKLEDALAAYRKALKIEPGNAVYKKNLADFYCLVLGEIRKAMTLYVEVLEKDPFDIEALLAMGHICHQMDLPDDAHTFFKRVLDVDPENQTASAKLSIIPEKPEKVDPAPTSASTYTELLSSLQGDDTEVAIDKIEAFLVAFPKVAAAHSDLAALYREREDIGNAKKHYRMAVHLQKDNLQFQKNLADFYLVGLGHEKRALSIYRHLSRKQPQNTEFLLMAGHLSVATGQLDRAESYYRKILALDPEHHDARRAVKGIERMKGPASPSPRSSLSESPPSSTDSEDRPERPVAARPNIENQRSQPLISILIPAAGPVKALRRCLEAIARHTPEPHEIIVVDNGITKGAAKWVRNFSRENSHCRMVACKTKGNMATAFNKGISACSGSFVLRLSDDVEATPGWLTALLAHFKYTPDAGVIGAISNIAPPPQKISTPPDQAGAAPEDFAVAYHKRNRHRRIPVESVDRFSMLMRRRLVDEIGFFDEKIGIGGYEAEDFCLRASLAGYQNLIAGDVYLHRQATERPVRSKKHFYLKWSGTDIERIEIKHFLAMRMEAEAIRACQAEDIHRAGELFLKSIGLLPDRGKGYLSLVEMLMQTQQYKDALQVLEAMPRESRDIASLVMRARCEARLGHQNEALKLSSKALEMAPNHAAVLNIQGVLAKGSGDVHSARKWFQRSMETDPGFGEAYTNLAMLLWETGDQRAALDLYERGFMLSPSRAEIATAYHHAVSDLNAYEQACPIVGDAVASYPYSKKIRYMYIDIQLHLKCYPEAMCEVEKAMADFGVEDGILSSAQKLREQFCSNEVKSTKARAHVSLCMIVKDEEKHLARCLASVKPVVDEMIVVDTGSSDRSPDIARAFGARVVNYPWSGDFSAARNHALSKARGTAIFVMDADEALSPLDYELFRNLCEKCERNRQAFMVNTRNYTFDSNQVRWEANEGHYGELEAGIGWTPSTKTRIFPNDPDVRFDFPVHEMVEPSLKRTGIRIKPCDLQIHHYGKLNRRRTLEKGEMYYQIGRQKLDQTNFSAVALRELAVQAEILKKHDEAIELWHRYIAKVPHEPKAYIHLGISYCSLHRYDKVLETAEKTLELLPDSKEGHYHFALAKLHLGFPKQARKSLEKLCMRLPEYLPAQFLLAASLCADGEKEKAEDLLDQLSRTAIGSGLAIRCHELATTLIASGRITEALTLLEAAIDSKHSNKDVLELYHEQLGQTVLSPKTGTYAK